MPMPVFQGSPERIIPKLRKLKKLNEAKKEAEDKLSEIKKKQTAMEEEIFLFMQADDVQSVDVEGSIFYRRLDRYFSINKDRKEAAYNWLKSAGYEDLFQETINARTLTAEMKIRIDEEDLSVPDEFINTKIVRRIGIKKQRR